MNRRGNDGRRRDPHIRYELVERVRREIAEGTYETPQKLAIALQRLVDRLDNDDRTGWRGGEV